MRFVVYGAGAVGGVLGGLLHEAGHDVLLVARGAHLRAVRDDGLRLESPAGSRSLAVPVAAGDEIGWRPGDVVLVAVKSHHTAAVVSALAAVAPAETEIVCVQNGVANEPVALRFFGHVSGVCVMMPAAHLRAGVVEAHSEPVAGILDIGRYPSGVDDRTVEIADAFTGSGLVSEPRADIMRWKHRKLLMNLGNAVQACCRPGAAADELRSRVGAEGEAVLRAAGIEAVSEAEDRERRGDILRVQGVAGRARAGGSSWQSLQRTTGSIETDYLNGEIVLRGREYDVPTPANELVRRTAVRMARAREQPGTLDAADLLRLLG